MSATERRAQIVAAAAAEFADRGLHGSSTETIAKAADITQPYIFRLFGTKRELFIAALVDVYERATSAFEDAVGDATGPQALAAMGRAYVDLLADRTVLLIMLHGFAACDDEQIRDTVRREYGRLWRTAQRLSGLPADRVKRFMALGALLNCAAAMDLDNSDEEWAQALLEATPVESL